MLFPIWFSSLFWKHRQTTLPSTFRDGREHVTSSSKRCECKWYVNFWAKGFKSQWAIVYRSQRVRHNWSTEQACTCYLHTFSLEASVGFGVPSMVSCTMQISFLLLFPIWIANPHLSLFILHTWRQVSFPFKTFHWIVMMETKAIFII